MDEHSIPTPALMIDLSIAMNNIQRMAHYTSKHNLQLRPHTKTHKSLRMARAQMAAGAVGLTVAKAGEAEIMGNMADDILIAYPALDQKRCSAIARLATRNTVRVAVDSRFAVEALASHVCSYQTTVGILIDIDVGHHRTGLQSPADSLELAQVVDRTDGVRLDGLMIFPGHVTEILDRQKEKLQSISDILDETVEVWNQHRFQPAIVSGGSTPTAYQSHLIRHLTEIRPGTYIYNDMNCVKGQWCGLDDCAASIITIVVSNAVPGKAVIDAGSKALTSDRLIHAPEGGGFGYVVEYPSAKIVRLSEEHGEIDLSGCERVPELGERIHVIPNHICPCVNLQNSVWIKHPNGEVEESPVDTRGKLS